MWKIKRKSYYGVEHCYKNEYIQVNIRIHKEDEKLTLVYFSDADEFRVFIHAECGCFQSRNQNQIIKFVKRRPYKKLEKDERFKMVKTVISERLHLEEVVILTGFSSYSCPECSCSRCQDYLESCKCRCESDHLMKDCSCVCPECKKKLTQCDCWCATCSYPVFSEEHEIHCHDEGCDCCPCCGCTCGDSDFDYDDEDEEEDEDEERLR